MDFWCYERKEGEIVEREFLNTGAKQYLNTCEPEIFEVWKDRSTKYSDVSLANTLSKTIKAKFEERSIGMNPNVSSQYSVYWLFQHRNDTAGKFLDFYKTAFRSDISDFLLITQSSDFKYKFMFDGSTMTFESINDDFNEFVDILKPQKKLRLFYLVLADLNLYTSSIEKSGKQFLQLHESDFSRAVRGSEING